MVSVEKEPVQPEIRESQDVLRDALGERRRLASLPVSLLQVPHAGTDVADPDGHLHVRCACGRAAKDPPLACFRGLGPHDGDYLFADESGESPDPAGELVLHGGHDPPSDAVPPVVVTRWRQPQSNHQHHRRAVLLVAEPGS